MNVKKALILISLFCVICLSACGEQAVTDEASAVASTASTSYTTTVSETKAETQKQSEAEADYDIPDEAVTKKTSITYWNGEQNFKTVSYLNEYGDELLRLYETEPDEYSEDRRCSYEYDADGKLLSEKSRNWLDEDEELIYEYYPDGEIQKISSYRNGWLQFVNDYTYDEYGNILTFHMVTYYFESDEVSFDYTEDYSDCDYDENGNMKAYRFYNSSDGSLYYTVSNRYDENNQLVYSEKLYADYGKADFDGIYMVATEYAYDNNGNTILEDEIRYSALDTIKEQNINHWEYNSENLIIKFSGEYHNGNKEQTEHIYESL